MKRLKKILETSLILILSTTMLTGCEREEAVMGISAAGTLIGGVAGFVALFKDSSPPPVIQIQTVPVETPVTNEIPQTVPEIKNSDATNSSTESATVKTQTSVSATAEDTLSKKAETQTENKKTTTPKTSNNDVEYKHFEDTVYGFSFDYPVRIGNATIEEYETISVLGNAQTYTLNLPSRSYLEMGTDFSGNINEVRHSLMIDEKSGRAGDVEIEQLDDSKFKISYIIPNERAHCLQYSYFKPDPYSGGIQHYFVRHTFQKSTPESEFAIASRVMESFQPPTK